ncbi:MAG: ethanolamine permease [Actinomycetota bacterium]
MSERRKLGSVEYREVSQDYFDQRGLRRHAGVFALWSLGVAAVISGDFFGWNFGLGVGGFGGLLVATVFITVMYYGLCYSIAEMSPALPHTGGAYSFARSAMGPWGGFVTGLAENMEYVITPAVVVVSIGAYMSVIMTELFDLTSTPFWNTPPFWWAIFYLLFVGLNIAGIEATMRFTIVINIMALLILGFFFVAAITKFDASLLFNIPDGGGDSLPNGGGPFLPFGIGGIFKALPFAIWFYLAIEELPLAAEESMDPKRDIPRATIWGMTTLVVTGVLVLVLNPGVSGANETGATLEPLFLGFTAIFPNADIAALLALIAVVGLVASFFTIIFAYGRNIFSLSRAGYFPQWLSVTHGQRRTPHVALIVGAVIGYILAYVIYKFGYDDAGATTGLGAALLTMAVFGAVISYAMQCLSFIVLRRKLPNIQRPYRSPLGEGGAAIAGVIAVIALISLFLIRDYRWGVIGTLIWFVLGLVYFAIAGRNRLVLSPEEEFALTLGEKGVPGETFGTSGAEQEAILRAGGPGTPPPPTPPPASG